MQSTIKTASGDSNDHVETMNRQDRCNHPIKSLSNGGDFDDRDDHMETKLIGKQDLSDYCDMGGV